MTNTNEGLLLDPDGIPILTDLVREDATPDTAEHSRESRNDEVSVDELAALLLNSDTFRKELDIITAELIRTVREQLELALRSTLEEAISLALDDGSTACRETVRKQLEATLPGLLARTLQD
jgi:hypothetical protein